MEPVNKFVDVVAIYNNVDDPGVPVRVELGVRELTRSLEASVLYIFSGVNILQDPWELSPNRISNFPPNSCMTYTFIKVKFDFSFKMIKLFPRFMKRGNISPKKYLGIMRNIHPCIFYCFYI